MSANGGASVARCGWLTCNQPLRATDRTEAGERICLAGHVQTGPPCVLSWCPLPCEDGSKFCVAHGVIWGGSLLTDEQVRRGVITGTDYVTEAVVVHEGCTAETANTVGDQCLTCGARKQYVTQPETRLLEDGDGA